MQTSATDSPTLTANTQRNKALASIPFKLMKFRSYQQTFLITPMIFHAKLAVTLIGSRGSNSLYNSIHINSLYFGIS
jgi:hypothetical protein